MENYLPSKQFIKRVLSIIALLIIAVCVYKIAIFFKNKLHKDNSPVVIEPGVIQKDSNNNGIPDWEESLWGLDPKGNGDSNKEFIMIKRETLAKENGADSKSNEPLSENETLSREFFAIVMSLQESGNLDENSMQSIAETIGQKIVAVPLPNKYTKDMVSTIKANPANTDAYSTKVANLIKKYEQEDLGKELTFISVGLSTNDPQAFAEADKVADLYDSFSKELIKIQVPNTLSDIHLSLANNYENVSQSIKDMSQMLVEPLLGMKALINYKKYTDAIVNNVTALSNAIQ